MRRGAVASYRGTYFVDDVICGFPISIWIVLTEEIYAIGGMGYQFNGWPDGKCLIEQEQCVVDITKVILMAIIKEMNDGKK